MWVNFFDSVDYIPQEKVDQYMIDLMGFTRQKEACMYGVYQAQYVCIGKVGLMESLTTSGILVRDGKALSD